MQATQQRAIWESNEHNDHAAGELNENREIHNCVSHTWNLFDLLALALALFILALSLYCT